MNCVFVGPPGAGKGTQAIGMCQRHGLAHLSTGDMLRAAVANETETGLKAKDIMARGALVSDDIMIAIISDRIEEPDCVNGFVLDGFPRTLPQAEALKKLLAERELRLDLVINFNVPDETLKERILKRSEETGGARDDDSLEVLAKRLDVYRESTAPLLPYYRTEGILREIDGTKDIETVTGDVELLIKELASVA